MVMDAMPSPMHWAPGGMRHASRQLLHVQGSLSQPRLRCLNTARTHATSSARATTNPGADKSSGDSFQVGDMLRGLTSKELRGLFSHQASKEVLVVDVKANIGCEPVTQNDDVESSVESGLQAGVAGYNGW